MLGYSLYVLHTHLSLCHFYGVIYWQGIPRKSIKILDGSLTGLQVEAFNHFEKLLSPTVYLQWKDITKDRCNGDTYVILGGRHIRDYLCTKPPRRQAWLHIFIKLFGPQDSAKQIQQYMTTNISINTNIMSMCQESGQIQELNKLLPYMSCFCHKLDSSAVIKIVKKYTPLKT